MIYVECKPDRVLIQTLTGREVEHLANKSAVFRVLQQKNNNIGIVDEDPNSPQPPYLRKMKLVKKQNNVTLYRDANRNKVIILSPRLEEWILEAVRQEKIQISNFGLPEDPNQFSHIVNFNIGKFQQLLHQLKQNKRLSTLREFILDQ